MYFVLPYWRKVKIYTLSATFTAAVSILTSRFLDGLDTYLYTIISSLFFQKLSTSRSRLGLGGRGLGGGAIAARSLLGHLGYVSFPRPIFGKIVRATLTRSLAIANRPCDCSIILINTSLHAISRNFQVLQIIGQICAFGRSNGGVIGSVASLPDGSRMGAKATTASFAIYRPVTGHLFLVQSGLLQHRQYLSCVGGLFCSYTHFRVPTHPGKSLKVFEFFHLNSRPWKYLKTGQVLESPWISFHSSSKVLEFTNSHCAISATSLKRYFA